MLSGESLKNTVLFNIFLTDSGTPNGVQHEVNIDNNEVSEEL